MAPSNQIVQAATNPNNMNAAAAAAAAAAGQQPQMNAAPAQYPGYSLANVDMSSFSGVDWSSMYGMYV